MPPRQHIAASFARARTATPANALACVSVPQGLYLINTSMFRALMRLCLDDQGTRITRGDLSHLTTSPQLANVINREFFHVFSVDNSRWMLHGYRLCDANRAGMCLRNTMADHEYSLRAAHNSVWTHLTLY